ncbi:carbohydrate-binding module 1 [Elasticomyces elasticus]|nr:carbohydrate-binding module 1 [Elasticomyces elasticus]KAK3640858.1 carbohydrate-binding module 1 [Elasticomyces elasticus]KAK4920340.1 carbohydrate-binding module 1 [Elasticomyces elasticus]KAK5759047.1 carbohydrate-binding module 1 [Elasticomyces elasticus]
MSSFLLLALAAISSSASAQHAAAAYSRCGGMNYQGTDTCTSGFYCHSYNPWYARCEPGTGKSSLEPSSSKCETCDAWSTTNTRIGQPDVWGSITLTYSTPTSGSDAITITPTSSAEPTSNGDPPDVYGSVTLTYATPSAATGPITLTPTAIDPASSTGEPAMYGSVTLTYSAPSAESNAITITPTLVDAVGTSTEPAVYGSITLTYSAPTPNWSTVVIKGTQS